MTMNASLHRTIINKTEVAKLDSSWVVRLTDENGNHVSIFLDRAQDIYELSKHLVSLTVAELSNPYTQDKINV